MGGLMPFLPALDWMWSGVAASTGPPSHAFTLPIRTDFGMVAERDDSATLPKRGDDWTMPNRTRLP